MSRQFAVLALALLAPLSAFGKSTLVYTGLDGSAAHEIVIHDGDVYIGDAEGGMLFIAAEDQMYFLDHEDKVAVTFSEEDAAAMKDSMDAMMAKMEKELASMPPEQAAMVRNMMKQEMPAVAKKVSSDARETGDTDSVNGVKCRVWIVSVGGDDKVSNCIAKPGDLKMGKADYLALRAAFTKMQVIQQSFSQSFGGAEQPGMGFGDFDGVPVKTIMISDGEVSELEEVSGDADAARTTVPANYDIRAMSDEMR